jgi:TolB protein
LAKDRVKIHQISDFIFNQIFHKNGISSAKILFAQKKKTGKAKDGTFTYESQIIESDYDGYNTKPLMTASYLLTTPQWISARSKEVVGGEKQKRPGSFLYVSYELGQPKIFYVSKNRAERASSLRGNQLTPAISPDGSSLAFCSDVMGEADLFFVPFDSGIGSVGKPRQIYHAKGTATACPTFSPDGKRIAFVSNKDGSPKIYVMDIPPSGTKVQDLKPILISKKCKEATSPSWSLDGKKIVYSGRTRGDRQLWLYDFERDQEFQLTDSAGAKESPSWAPDSLHIAFHMPTSSGSELYMINLHQTKPVKISSGSYEKFYVVWESDL